MIHESPPGIVDRGPLRRELRRALLIHDEEDGPFALEVSKEGLLRFCGEEYQAEITGGGLARSALEPPEVKRALDMYEVSPDEGLKSFLLVKAVDEALAAVLVPQLSASSLVSKARALPTRPGKRRAVRPEAVQRKVEGWDNDEAVRAAEKVAAQRVGPDWARLPRGAYLLRLFLDDSDELAGDLLALGAALKQMEKGSEIAGTDERALRALSNLLALLDSPSASS